jgi:hypothetical protein
MEDTQYKDFISKCHPELLKEADDYFKKTTAKPAVQKKKRTKLDRGSWAYICYLLPKLKDFEHNTIGSDGSGRQHGWYIHAPVVVGCRTAEIGIRIWVHTTDCSGLKEKPLSSKQHYLEFYLCFDNYAATCYESMSNLPGVYAICQGKKLPRDLKTQRNKIYKYFGIKTTK